MSSPVLTFFLLSLFSWILTKPIMEMLSVDYSLPIGLSGVGIALAFHLEHSSQSNQIHLTFALSVRTLKTNLKARRKKNKRK